MYRRIVKRKLTWPKEIKGDSQDFIDKLLCVDPLRRLGCLLNGSKDVRDHKWFTAERNNFDFKSLEAKKYPAPFVPKIKSAIDGSNFDPYGEDDGKLNFPDENFPKEQFADFAQEWV